MKRGFALVLSLILVLTLILAPVTATAAGSGSIVCDSASVKIGDEFTISVSVSGNPGFCYLEMTPVYSAELTLVSVSNGGLISDFTKGRQYVWVSDEDVPANGTLLTMTFKVEETVPEGQYEVGFTVRTCGNLNEEPVSMSVTKGIITVTCPHTNTTDIPEEPATCDQGGYTAGVYCNTCKTYVSGHEPTNPTGQHVDADGAWEKDDANHWHTCSCGQVFESAAHDGGTATCIAKAVCGACGAEYGDVNSNNHAGQTTVINAVEADHNTQTPGYTGDTKCLDCNEIISYGQVINPSAHTPAADWTSDDTHHWKVCSVSGCDYVFEDTKAAHSSTGTNQANCQRAAICDHCGATYGSVASHSYTAETKSAAALKSAGDCCNEAVYYYSCSGCGQVEGNDNHTFKGEKDAAKHVGGTTLINASEADHNTQTPGYTGDTQCNGCKEIIENGKEITPTPHVGEWKHDENTHWQVCTVSGCGIVIEGTTANHRSTGKNVANCQKAAVCDDCGITYGTVAGHSWYTTWSSDETGHWHDCMNGGCSEKGDFEAHTPDHVGGATEEYPIRCDICKYIMEAQLAHPHVYDQEVVADEYKATEATCTAKATYYKTCKCGEKGTETFAAGELAEHTWVDATCTTPKTCTACNATEGEALGHTAGGEWQKDATGHWQLCTVEGCGAVVESSKAAHTPDHEGGATEEYPVRCTVCSYIIEAQLAHPHVYDQKVATSEYKATEATCTSKATYYLSCKCGDKGTETFESGELAEHTWADATCTTPKTCTVCNATEGEALGHTAGTEWKCDKDNHWYVCVTEGCGAVVESTVAAHTPDRSTPTYTDPVLCSVCGYMITPELGHVHAYGEDLKSDGNGHWTECVCGDKTQAQAHADEDKNGECDACGYEMEIPSEEPVEEGDNNLVLWIAVAAVAVVAVAVVIIVATKKKAK